MPAQMPAAQLVPGGEGEAMPKKLEPMLPNWPTPVHPPGWAWEPKLDGYRVLAFIQGGKGELRSRAVLELAGDFRSWRPSWRSRVPR